MEPSAAMEELRAEVEAYFAGLEECHFRDGIKALEHSWTKCISLQGDYVEKKTVPPRIIDANKLFS